MQSVGHHSAYLHPQTVSKPWVSAAGTHPCRSNRYLGATARQWVRGSEAWTGCCTHSCLQCLVLSVVQLRSTGVHSSKCPSLPGEVLGFLSPRWLLLATLCQFSAVVRGKDRSLRTNWIFCRLCRDAELHHRQVFLKLSYRVPVH